MAGETITVLQCSSCGITHAARPIFCRCGSQEFGVREVSGHGRVYSCTTLYAAAEPFEKDLPFQIAIIDVEDGPRLTARISGRAVQIGDAVTLVERRDGVYFFRAA